MLSLLQATHVQDDAFNDVNTHKTTTTTTQGLKSPHEREREHLEKVKERRKGFNGIHTPA